MGNCTSIIFFKKRSGNVFLDDSQFGRVVGTFCHVWFNATPLVLFLSKLEITIVITGVFQYWNSQNLIITWKFGCSQQTKLILRIQLKKFHMGWSSVWLCLIENDFNSIDSILLVVWRQSNRFAWIPCHLKSLKMNFCGFQFESMWLINHLTLFYPLIKGENLARLVLFPKINFMCVRCEIWYQIYRKTYNPIKFNDSVLMSWNEGEITIVMFAL